MGWKLNMIVISGYKRGIDDCLAEIGHNYHKRAYGKVGETILENCLNPGDDKHLYIGECEGLKIITEANLPFEFLTESKNLVEHLFSVPTIIPSRRIHVLVLNSTTNLWGYNIIQMNKRVRCKFGNHDNGVLHEEGEPQEFEKNF